MAKRWEAYLPPRLALSPLMEAFIFCPELCPDRLCLQEVG